MITLTVLFCMALSLSAPALAANRYSMERREKETTLPYTFGDLAAARLAVYGLLDGRFRTPQPETAEPLSRLDAVKLLWNAFAEETAPEENGGDSKNNRGSVVLYSLDSSMEDADESGTLPAFLDVPAEYTEPVAWACRNGITQGLTDTRFGIRNASETEFTAMLLNLMSFRGKYACPYAVRFAESIGLAPLGLSRNFTLGDAALYLQAAMDCQTADGTILRERMNLPAKPDQTTFPDSVILTPLCASDAEAQIRAAARYLAERIEIRGEYLRKTDLIDLYLRYCSTDGNAWYLSCVKEEYGLYPELDTMDESALPAEERTAYESAMTTLREQFDTSALSGDAYWLACARERARYLCSGRSVTLTASYNEAWELACDLDDAFTLYEDDRITRRADSFYQNRMADAETEAEKVYAAKNAIIAKAEYASAAGYDGDGAYYAREFHSILGFFNKSQVVCDGYASVFQYLMIRAGMECVTVRGSTVSRKAAEANHSDHVWNKVKVDGKWLGMDVCWSDTGFPYTFDLQSDDFYANHRHWAVTYKGL